MTDEEAEKLWASPRCDRCKAMESRLAAAIIANKSLQRGLERVTEALEESTTENKKLLAALAEAVRLQRWLKA